MIMNLKWISKDEKQYVLGTLTKQENLYKFVINEEGLKDSIKNGCMGIGNMNLAVNTHISEKLFCFFKNRIPQNNHPKINEILKKYEIEDYDEWILLEKTKGIMQTDRYFLEETKPLV